MQVFGHKTGQSFIKYRGEAHRSHAGMFVCSQSCWSESNSDFFFLLRQSLTV